MGYTYLWEFTVAPAHAAEFAGSYGATGAWVALFRRSPGYLGSWLLRDQANPLRFITVDRWQDEAAYRRFRSDFAREYAELDARCERLTAGECALGSYDEA